MDNTTMKPSLLSHPEVDLVVRACVCVDLYLCTRVFTYARTCSRVGVCVRVCNTSFSQRSSWCSNAILRFLSTANHVVYIVLRYHDENSETNISIKKLGSILCYTLQCTAAQATRCRSQSNAESAPCDLTVMCRNGENAGSHGILTALGWLAWVVALASVHFMV